mgnify:CR=1 FL=1
MAPLTELYRRDHGALVQWLFKVYGLGEGVALQNPHRIRRESIADRLDLYRDKPERALTKVINQIYTTDRMRMALLPYVQVAIEQNVTRRITNKVASLYDRPAMRVLADRDVEFHTEEKRLGLHFIHQEAHRLTNVCNETLIWQFKGINDETTLRIITPDCFDAVPDPRDRLMPAGYVLDAAPLYPLTPADAHSMPNYEIWDDTYRYLVNAYGAIVDENGGPGRPVEHGLGRIPGVLFHRREPTTCILDDSYGEDLKSAHLGIALLEVMIMRLSKVQGENQPVLQGNLAAVASGQVMDGENPLALPPDVIASMLNTKTDPDHYLKVQRQKIDAIAQSRGLSYEQLSNSAQGDSGKLYQMNRQELTELRLEQRLRAQTHEAQTAELIGFNSDGMRVDFQEQAVPADAGEEVDLLDKKMRKGLASPVDYLMSKDPDLTRELAIQRLLANLEDYAMLIAAVRALNIPGSGDAANPGMTPQQNGAMGGRPPAEDNSMDVTP